ncbi:MAG: hypothetical protein ACYDCL_19660 [Myxococcales bacterium]
MREWTIEGRLDRRLRAAAALSLLALSAGLLGLGFWLEFPWH